MLHTKIIDIKKEKIKISIAENFITSSKFGASIFFIGTERNTNQNKEVTGITYDSHDGLVIKSFEEIYQESDKILNIKDKAVFIEHIKGELMVRVPDCPQLADKGFVQSLLYFFRGGIGTSSSLCLGHHCSSGSPCCSDPTVLQSLTVARFHFADDELYQLRFKDCLGHQTVEITHTDYSQLFKDVLNNIVMALT